MITIGVDFHKNTSTYSVRDEGGRRLRRCKLENQPEIIRRFLDQWPGPKKIAMEATRNWGLFYETVRPHVEVFQLGHPKKMKAITESETKCDNKDADLISLMAHTGFFPQAHVASLETRQLRSILRYRAFLVNQRRAIRNQVQILLDRNLWPCQRPGSFKDPFCRRGMEWLRAVELPPRERLILDSCLEAFERLNTQIQSLEQHIRRQDWSVRGLKYLRQVPGFRNSIVNAYVVLLEADDLSRFHKARHFAHYAGLIPSEHSSGDQHRTGRLVKGANMFLRTALIESVFAAVRTDPGLKSYYRSVQKRCGSGAAIIATARKLSYAVYHVVKYHIPYRPFPAGDCLGPESACLNSR